MRLKLDGNFWESEAYISQILSIDKIPDEIKEEVETSQLFDKEKLLI